MNSSTFVKMLTILLIINSFVLLINCGGHGGDIIILGGFGGHDGGHDHGGYGIHPYLLPLIMWVNMNLYQQNLYKCQPFKWIHYGFKKYWIMDIKK